MQFVNLYVRPRQLVKATAIVYITWKTMASFDGVLGRHFGPHLDKVSIRLKAAEEQEVRKRERDASKP